ncbi:MAG: M36 family metallopeptidase [Acidobacteria bacterium]|nr:M36 family metallopeptidase [Acidobacteriota bacterium]
MKKFLLAPLLAFLAASLPAQQATAPPAVEAEKQILLQRLNQASEQAWEMQWDPATQAVRQLRSGLSQAAAAPPAEAAYRFLMRQAELLDLPRAVELRMLDQTSSLLGTHVRFQQWLQGTPVYQSRLSVHLDLQGRVFWVNNQSASADRVTNRLQLAEGQAQAQALADLKPDLLTLRGPVRSMLYLAQRKGGLRYAWHVAVPANDPLGDWSYLIDAESGEILEKQNLLQFARARVLFPNPVVTLQDPALRDPAARDTGRDPTTAEANCDPAAVPAPAYGEVQLAGLFASGMLDGPFVTTGGALVPAAIRARGNPDFLYNRCDSRFNEVNVYYAIDSIQRYIQQLGFGNINNRPIPVNASGFITFGRSQDQSFYSPETGELVFGLGGIHDAEDGEIVAHEYGHAIQDNQIPGFGRTVEAQSIGEGFGDILAALFFVPFSGAFHDELIGEWDATFYDQTSAVPRLRSVESGMTFADFNPRGSVHRNGTIWAASLWDFYQRIGATVSARDAVLQALLESQFLYPPDVTFAEAAQALIAADQKLTGGANETLLARIFVERKILGDNSGLPAAQSREVEPNDSPPIAQALSEAEHVISAAISSNGDIDYYRLPVHANRLYVVEVYARRLSPPSPLDSFLAILDADGNPIPAGAGFLENDDIEEGVVPDSRVVFTSRSEGSLLIRVSSFLSETRGPYLLVVYPTENPLRIPRVASGRTPQLDDVTIPRVASGPDFTAVTLSNFGSSDAVIGLILLDDQGELVRASNPQILSLAGGQQISFLDSEQFGYASLASGWLQIQSSSPDVRGYVLYGDADSLLGAPAATLGSRDSVFLLAGASSASPAFPSSVLETEMSLVNPNASVAAAEITVYSSMGRAVASRRVAIPPFGRWREALSRWLAAPLPAGYVRVRSDLPLSGFEVHGDHRKTGLGLQAVPTLLPPTPSPQPPGIIAHTLAFPHFAETAGSGTGLSTILNLVNPMAQGIRATVSALTPEGTAFPGLSPQTVWLGPGEALEIALRDLFQISDLSRPYVGSLQIAGSTPGVLGAARFLRTDGQYVAAVAIESEPRRRFLFTHVAHGTVGGITFQTGVALQNPGSEPASYKLQVFSPDGALLAQTSPRNPFSAIAPGQRLAGLLGELLPDLPPVVGGYVVVESSQPLVGFELIVLPETLLVAPAQ